MEINVLRLIDECINNQLCESLANKYPGYPVPIGVSYGSMDKYPSKRPYGAWISNNGIIYFIDGWDGEGGHESMAVMILIHKYDFDPQLPEVLDNDDEESQDSFDAFMEAASNMKDEMFVKGFIRLVIDGSIYSAENGYDQKKHPLSPPQRRALKNISIKYNLQVYFNNRALRDESD